MKSRRIQQTGHLVLREEHGAGIQTSLVQLLLHQVPEHLEKICKKSSGLTGYKREARCVRRRCHQFGGHPLTVKQSSFGDAWQPPLTLGFPTFPSSLNKLLTVFIRLLFLTQLKKKFFLKPKTSGLFHRELFPVVLLSLLKFEAKPHICLTKGALLPAGVSHIADLNKNPRTSALRKGVKLTSLKIRISFALGCGGKHGHKSQTGGGTRVPAPPVFSTRHPPPPLYCTSSITASAFAKHPSSS